MSAHRHHQPGCSRLGLTVYLVIALLKPEKFQ